MKVLRERYTAKAPKNKRNQTNAPNHANRPNSRHKRITFLNREKKKTTTGITIKKKKSKNIYNTLTKNSRNDD